MPNPPRRLFKYRSLDGPYGLANVRQIIEDNVMRWQSPTSFNDPFDCSPNLFFGTSDAARKAWLTQTSKTLNPSANRHERRAAVAPSVADWKTHEASLSNRFHDSILKSAVTCFSLTQDHPLMWAHYGDSHGGVCFEFEEQHDDSRFVGLDVVYRTDRVPVDLTRFREGLDAIKSAILTKSDVWGYEREVRMIDYKKDAGPRAFPPAALKAVTFGLRTTPDNRARVIDMVRNRKRHIAVREAVLDGSTYAISSREVPVAQ